MLDFQASRWLMEEEVPKQAGNDHPTSIPTGVFRTSDGYINIATTGGRIWERCAEAIGAPDLPTRPEYATAPARSKNRDALNAEINALTEKKSTETWVRELNAAGVPCGPIYSIDQVFGDAQVQTSWHRAGRAKCREPSYPPGRPARHAVAHPQQNGGAAAGIRRADRRRACRIRL